MQLLIYLIFRAFEGAIILLPLKVNFRLGRFLGTFCFFLLWPYRRLVIANLTVAFGAEKCPAEIRGLARSHFATLGANLLSSLKLAKMSYEKIAPRVTIENIAIMETALAQRKGVVMVNNHSGAWEVYAQLAPHFPGQLCSMVYQKLGNRYIDAAVRADRTRFGVVPFATRDGFGPPIKFLREGGLASVMVDQHAGDGGVWTPLFGRLSATSPVAATLAARTGACWCPYRFIRLERHGGRLW